MKYHFKYFSALFFLYCISKSYANFKPSATTPLKIDSKSNVKLIPSKAEINLALQISSLFKDIENNSIKKKQITTFLEKKIKKENIFKSYIIWLKIYENILSIESFDLFQKLCTDEHLIKRDLSYFNKIEIKLCNSIYLKLARKSQFNPEIQFEVFKRLPFYLNKKNQASFFDEISQSKNFKNNISKLVANFALIKKESLDNNIVKSLGIDNDIVKFVENDFFFQKDYEVILKKQFYEYYHNLRKKLNTSFIISELEQNLNHLINFYVLNKNTFSRHSKITKRLLYISKKLSHRGLFDLSDKLIYRTLLYKNNKEYYSYLFHYIWNDISQSHYKKALNKINKHKSSLILSNMSTQLIFWTGYVYGKTNNRYKSNAFLKYIIKNNPLTYYAILASKYISKINNEENNFLNFLLQTKEEKNISPENISRYSEDTIKRLTAWLQIDRHKFINLEINSILQYKASQDINGHENIKAVSKILLQHKKYLKNFSFLYSALNDNKIHANKNILISLFPTPFKKQILETTKKRVDPYLVLSLIRQESAFNPRARSPVGARGLMQLMPRTARSIQKVSNRKLNDPRTNIKIGTIYLKKLLKKFDNNIVFSLSAYNAGETKLRRWLKYNKQKEMLKFIENIPIKETRYYVKLIYRNIFFYKMLNMNINDTSNFNRIYDLDLKFNI